MTARDLSGTLRTPTEWSLGATQSLEGTAATLDLEPDDLYRHLVEDTPFPHLDPDVVGLAALAGQLSLEDRARADGFIRGLRAREEGKG